MRRSILLIATLLLSLSLPLYASGAAGHAKGDSHGTQGAKPGSHEDWCSEHNVPESQCTRCDASLVPAFKATGDWCKQHGLPKSHCKKCNPSLKIVRPPKGM